MRKNLLRNLSWNIAMRNFKNSKLNPISPLVKLCAMLVVAVLFFNQSATMAQTAATLTVDCAVPKGTLFRTEQHNNVSGKNTGAATRDADYQFMNSQGLHAKVLRVWIDEKNIYNNTTGTFDWTIYTDYFNDVSTHLADDILINITGNAMIWEWKKTPAECKAIIKPIIKYYKLNYPKVKFIEGLNEPDNYHAGVGKGMDSTKVYSYYKMFYEAVNEVNAELNPAVPLKVGGFALMSFKYTGRAWIRQFLKDYKNDTAPAKKLDFLSYHTYSYKKWPKQLGATRDTVEKWLTELSLPTTIPSYLTEVGVFPGGVYSGTEQDDALVQAAGMASCLYWITEDSKNVPFNWVMRHADATAARKDQIVTRPTSYSDRLTPYGNMMKMMGMMKTDKVAATSNVMDVNGLGLYGLASSDATGVSIVSWNYQHTALTDYTTTVAVNNLPATFTNKKIRRQIYKIDQTTSNNFFDVNNCNLQLISDTELPNSTSLNIALGVMKENSLQMIILTPGSIQAPTVAVTSPADGTTFTAPASITINATASDVAPGTVASVSFYRNDILIGTDTTSPYSFTWTNALGGDYAITAKATDNNGAVTTSAPISLTVNTPPTVSITSPTNGTSVAAPGNITINATAADTAPGTVTSVAFYNGTTLLNTDTTSPYSFTWSNVASGTYSITAKATDNSGAVTTSAVTSVTVTAPVNTPPTVSVTSPVAGTVYTAPASITLNATASDTAPGTVTSVSFYRGGTILLGTDNTSPYSFTWTNVLGGDYVITAKATDNNGAVTTSAEVDITVNTPPTVSLTSPTTGSSYTAPATISIAATASDTAPGTVTSVAFYSGSTLLGTDTTSPFSFSWTSATPGTYSLTARATDNSGAITTSSAVSITVYGIVSGATYRIVSRSSGKSLDVKESSLVNGGAIHQWDYVANANQHWIVTSVGSGNYKIINVNSAKALDVKDKSLLNAAIIHQWDYSALANQHWQIGSLGGGYYKVTNANSTKALDVKDNSLVNGGIIHQYTYGGATNQQWEFVRVTGAAAVASIDQAFDGVLTSSLKENVEQAAITLYPNPATNVVNLVGNDLKGYQTIYVVDVMGKVLSSQKISGASTETISVSNLTEGMYIIRLQGNQGKAVHLKFFKVN